MFIMQVIKKTNNSVNKKIRNTQCRLIDYNKEDNFWIVIVYFSNNLVIIKQFYNLTSKNKF